MSFTFEKAVSKVAEISKNYHDEAVSPHEIKFESLNHAVVSGQRVELMASAKRLVSGRFRVPVQYLERCPSDLQAENLNYWIGREAKERDQLLLRFDGLRLRAVFTTRYKPLDNLELLNELPKYGVRPETPVSLKMDNDLFMLQIPDHSKKFGVGKGDSIVPGVSLTNSETGVMALSIEAFFLRLVCTNGLVTETKENQKFRHTSKKALDNFQEALANVGHAYAKKQDQLAISMDSHVDRPMESILSLGKKFGLDKEDIELVQNSLNLEYGNTMFHVINAFTRAAQHPTLEASDIYKMQRAGGQVLSLVKA